MKANTPTSEEEINQEPINEEPEKSPKDKAIDSLFVSDWKEAEKVLKEQLPIALKSELKEAGLEDYNPLLFLDQSNSIGEEHADRIYSALCKFEQNKDILLIMGSRGGSIEPAYLISKNCKSKSKEKFVVVVPRRAKSAATLISMGADEIHMGSMSELGPIDPQLGRVPALALSNALDTIARLVSNNPGSSEMFAKYLESQLDLGILGYFERINESAEQYATRLLSDKKLGEKFSASELSYHLVNHYKDHSFVIDKDEASELFGNEIIKFETPEYVFSNSIDQTLRLVSRIIKYVHRKEVTFVGSFDNCLKIKDIEK